MKCDRCSKSLEETLVYVVGNNHGFCIGCVWEMVSDAARSPAQSSLNDHE